jgi:hypothetical protein
MRWSARTSQGSYASKCQHCGQRRRNLWLARRRRWAGTLDITPPVSRISRRALIGGGSSPRGLGTVLPSATSWTLGRRAMAQKVITTLGSLPRTRDTATPRATSSASRHASGDMTGDTGAPASRRRHPDEGRDPRDTECRAGDGSARWSWWRCLPACALQRPVAYGGTMST